MLKLRLTPSNILPILLNLIPLFGVWFLGWDAAQIFLVYALETVIIGAVNVLKMATVTIFVKPSDTWENGDSKSMQSGWFFIFFFIIHYGFFVFVQTQLFFAVSGLIKDGSMFGKYAQVPAALGEDGTFLFISFIVYHLVQAYLGFIRTGQYKTISMGRLMFQPYIRIVIQQIVVILGSMFLTFGLGKIFIVVLVGVTIFFEVFVNFDSMWAVAEKKKEEEEINN